MRWLAVALAFASVCLFALAVRRPDMAAFVGTYLDPPSPSGQQRASRVPIDPGAVAWVVTGSFTGLLVAQGDLFLAGPGRSVGVSAALGAAAGWFGFSARRSTLHEQRSRRLRFELPVISDALALQVLSGESVSSAVSAVVQRTHGVASDELRSVLAAAETDVAFDRALGDAGRTTAHPDARRLYEVLAHAHIVGGRLADSLLELATDYRASLERDLTSESGRRMVTTYGPVLALMVPTALLFLLYPTLMGLRTLSGAP